MPFPEARERLMNRIKQDNAEIKQQENEIGEIRKMNEQYQRNIKDISNELAGVKSADSAQEDQKFEILHQKEREIQEFSAKFDSEKAKYEREIADN